MLKNLIVLPDGTELFSGTGEVNALQNVTLTQQVNSGAELTLGSACANMLEATMITPAGDLTITPGMEVTLYKVTDSGARTKVGLFTAEKLTRPSANLYKITAYDRVSWLDKDLTQWLKGLNKWPYTLIEFARMVCQACGLTLATETIPNGDWKVNKFSASSITGRQLMKWVGEASGRFCRANASGKIELAWYTKKSTTLTPDGDLPLVTVQMEDYKPATVDKVQIQITENDIGAAYGEGSNVYRITGNYLLTSDQTKPLQAVAQVLHGILQSVDYAPGKVRIPANTQISAGDIISVTDRNKKTFSVYVMSKVQNGPWETLSCSGSANRDSSTATNNAQLSMLNGRMMEFEIGLEGLRIENQLTQEWTSDLELAVADQQSALEQTNTAVGQLEANDVIQQEQIQTTVTKTASLELTVDGLSTSVSEQQTKLDESVTKTAELELTVDGLSTSVSEQQTKLDESVTKTAELELTVNGLSTTVSEQTTALNESVNKTAELEIKADRIGTTVTQVEGRVTRAESEIEQTAEQIKLKVGKGEVVSAINLSPEEVKISANKIALEGYTTINESFSVDTEGFMKAIGGNIGGWTIRDGYMTAQAEAYIPPTYDDALYVLYHISFHDEYPKPEGADYDLNGDGKVTEADATLALNVVRGERKMKNCAGAVKKPVTITLTPADPQKTFLVSGVNQWGTRVENWFGIDMTDSPMATKDFVVSRTADHVVEQDTEGIWTYRKWASGLAECWGRLDFDDPTAIKTAWGDYALYATLPFDMHDVVFNVSCGQAGVAGAHARYHEFVAPRSVGCYMRDGADSGTIWAYYDVKGKWK